ncbi:MAG: hypothetical protein SGJ27_11260 [Candidatus Melainabacteria bacterium]|nr:hypothetical protein [Candidatus Melainabacteria bacterium]
MTASDTPSVKPAVKKKKNGNQGAVVLFILLLGVGGAGFGLGFTQKFVPIDAVSPDTTPTKITTIATSGPTATAPATTATGGATTPATSNSSANTTGPATGTGTNPATGSAAGTTVATGPATGTAGGTSSSTPSALKKAYWIETSGWDKAGYAITVYINDHPVGNFDVIDRTEDVTKFVVPGENKVRFEAKSLPAENRNDFTGAFLTVTINQGQKTSAKEFTDAQPVIEYKRKVTETTDFDETKEFAAI